MRVRSASIYTKREPAKVAEDVPNTPCDPSDFDFDLPQLMLKKNHSAGFDDISFDDFGPLCESTCKDNFIGDFKPMCARSEDNSPTLTSSTASRGSDSLGSSTCPLELAEMQGELQHQQQQKVCRGMVIGARDTGKRTLIKAMFKDSHGEYYKEKKAFDLAIRTVEDDDDGCAEKYHFWIKEPLNNVDYPQCLLDTYYGGCSVFFLVYDVEDRASFECLDMELGLIAKAKKNRDDVVILVGNKKKGEGYKKTIVQKEITALKHKHGIALFLEIDITKQTPSELRAILQGYLKELH